MDLLDMIMPEMGGSGTYERLKRSIPILKSSFPAATASMAKQKPFLQKGVMVLSRSRSS